MISELLFGEFAEVLLRMTLVLFAAWISVVIFRQRSPSLAIVIGRCMLVAMWVGPLLILSGWSMRFAVLPGQTETAATVAPINVAVENAEQIQAHDDTDKRPLIEAMTAEASHDDVQSEVSIEGRAETVGAAMSAARPGWEVAKMERVQSTSATVATDVASSDSDEARSMRVNPMLAIWILLVLITVFFLIRFAMRMVRTVGVIRRSVACSAEFAMTVNRVTERLQIGGNPPVRVSSEVRGPCTVGWFRPIVLLPAQWLESSSKLTTSQFEMILAHELTHARWQDAAWDAIGQITRSVWWFHPLVHAITREHRLACEHRCDAEAGQIVDDVDAYRRQLAGWALAIRDLDRKGARSESPYAALISLSMAERALILKRLRWLKAGRLSERVSVGRRVVAVTSMVFIALLCTAVQPTQRMTTAAQTERNTQSDEDSGGTKVDELPASAPVEEVEKDGAVAEGVLEVDHLVKVDRRKMLSFGDSEPEVDWDNPVTIACLVLNESGEPIADAEVQMSMLTDQAGESATFVLEGGTLSDSLGAFKILIPGGTRRFSVRVIADGYADFSNESFKVMDKVEIRMKSGRLVRIRATNKDDDLLPDAFPMVADSNVWGREFKKQENGMHLSPVLPPHRRWMWVVDGTAKDGVMLFSDLIDLADDMSADESGIVHVELSKGTRLEGVLSDEIPRPIKNGFVHVAVRDGEKHRIESFNRTGLVWHEHTAIKPDGTFVFPSLPRDAHAQIFVLCEGWQTVSPTKEEVKAYFLKHDAGSDKMISDTMNRYNSKPQLAWLDSRNSPVKVTIPCRKTASLDVRVVDPAGKPIAGATATMSPNLSFFGDLVIPGVELWNDELVRNGGAAVFGTNNEFATFASESFLSVTTDPTGVARFRNLPNLSESFEVETLGYVMAAYPTTDQDNPGRYGLAKNLRAGEVVKMTVTLEKDVLRTAREVTCVYVDGSPIVDLKVTLTAISTAKENADWQQWSVQRFGEVSKGVTDKNGTIRLAFPQTVDGQKVRKLLLHMEGVPREQVSAWSDLAVPAESDERVIRFTPEEKPRTEGSYILAVPEYVDLLSGSNATKPELLKSLLERNDLLSLKQLLTVNEYDALAPLELQPDLNRTELRNKSSVEQIRTRKGDRVVALATVRPKSARKASAVPSGSEAAFIFDTEGKLIRVLGGGTSHSDLKHNTMLTNLGGTFDFFVRVSGFESHPPYEYVSRWYKLDEPGKPALTVHHQANSGSWTAFQGTEFPLAEYAFLGYGLNGIEIDRSATAQNKSKAQVPRSLVWDRVNGLFLGELKQSFVGKPLYQVIADESAKFAEVSAEPEQAVVIGGRRDFQNWHLWKVVVQEGQPLTARLEMRDADGKTVRQIREDRLAPGQHTLQLLFEDVKQKKGESGKVVTESLLAVMLDAKDLKDVTKYKIPHLTVENSPTVKGQRRYFTAKPPLRIIEKQSSDKTQWLIWIIE